MKYTTVILAALMICSQARAAKPWMADLPAFVNDHPTGHWIVGQSPEPALSADEAESMARADAAGKIAQVLNCNGGESQAIIVSSLARSDWIVDRQIDSTQHPYGTIWHATILIDATSGRLDDLSRQIQFAVRRQHLHTAFLLAVSIGWLTVIGLCYLLINWITRGYFRGRLVMASLILILVGIFGAAHLL